MGPFPTRHLGTTSGARQCQCSSEKTQPRRLALSSIEQRISKAKLQSDPHLKRNPTKTFDTGALQIHKLKRDTDKQKRVDGHLGPIAENIPGVGPAGPALAVSTKGSVPSEEVVDNSGNTAPCEIELPSVTDDQRQDLSEESPTGSTPPRDLYHLSGSLAGKGQYSNWSGKSEGGDLWYSREAVQEVFNEATIRRVLRHLQRGRDDTLDDFIATRARMLFAIVVYSRFPEEEVFDYMDFFQQSGFSDSSLLTGFNHLKSDNQDELPVKMSPKKKTKL
ncbi:hypothetical protein ANO14919_041300 [Xylariales sp. No.14919]|nr:hypothetical protein ANO14919_041300 [Xylariales sp. No.14919]